VNCVRGWATRSSDGRTHAGYILNPGKSMRAYAVPGQRITLYSNRPPFTFPKRWITRWYIRTSLRSAWFTIFLFWLAGNRRAFNGYILSLSDLHFTLNYFRV
jgi:hypothetical protein